MSASVLMLADSRNFLVVADLSSWAFTVETEGLKFEEGMNSEHCSAGLMWWLIEHYLTDSTAVGTQLMLSHVQGSNRINIAKA